MPPQNFRNMRKRSIAVIATECEVLANGNFLFTFDKQFANENPSPSSPLGMTITGTRTNISLMRASHLEDFYQFLRFPSISTDGDYSEKVADVANCFAENLPVTGLRPRFIQTRAHPRFWHQT